MVVFIKSMDLGQALIVWGSRIDQIDIWRYLGPVQKSNMELFAKILFGYNPLNFLWKELT